MRRLEVVVAVVVVEIKNGCGWAETRSSVQPNA